MEITRIKLRLIDNLFNDTYVKATVDITLDDCFELCDIKIINNKNSEPFVAYPSRITKNHNRLMEAYPTNKSAKEKFDKKILDAYYARIEKIKEKPNVRG